MFTFSDLITVLLNLSPITWLIVVAPFAAYWTAGSVAGQVACRYMLDRETHRPVRRWYGCGCRVRPSISFPSDPVYLVTAWENEDGPVWVKVAPLAGDEHDSGWMRLSAVAPFEVPAFRPHLDRGLPRLTRYIPAVAR